MSDIVIFKDFKRSEVIESLREMYAGMLRDAKRQDRSLVSFPDIEDLLDHIEENGIPPKDTP